MSADTEQNVPEEEKPRGEGGQKGFSGPPRRGVRRRRISLITRMISTTRRSKVPDRVLPAVRVLGIALVLLSLVLFGCNAGPSGPGATPGGPPSATTGSGKTPASDLPTVTINASGGDELKVQVEIADDASERARGLMYRTALAENRGMLFIFPDEERLSFWMKNTFIPLSIAFIDSEGRIVDIQDMKPLDDNPPSYVSAVPARYALEVNQDFFDELGIKVGDRTELPR